MQVLNADLVLDFVFAGVGHLDGLGVLRMDARGTVRSCGVDAFVLLEISVLLLANGGAIVGEKGGLQQREGEAVEGGCKASATPLASLRLVALVLAAVLTLRVEAPRCKWRRQGVLL